MSLQRNYYEILGIPPGATTDQIKKKYRELARKFHPDIIQDKVLGQRVFTQINQAYRVLADPERREQYNSQLAASAAPRREARQRLPPRRQRRRGPPQTARSPDTGISRKHRRSRRAATARQPADARPQSGSAAQPRPAAPQGQPGTAQKAQAITGLLTNADNAIMAGKPMEARAFCVKALEIDPRNVRALEILGDALVQMGRREEAAVQYRNALQVAPSSLIQAKLNRLEQAMPPTRTNPPSPAIRRAGTPTSRAAACSGGFRAGNKQPSL